MIFGKTDHAIGFGTAALGGLYTEVSAEAAHEALDAAWRLEIRHFDTAPLYGSGLAESRLGEALSARPRDGFTVSTKVGLRLEPGRPNPLFGAPPLGPVFAEGGVSVAAAGVFNSGLLAGGTTFHYTAAPPEVVARKDALERMCARYDVPLVAAALQFPMRHAAVTSVVVGARSAAEIEEDVRLFDLPIPDALWAELDEAAR